MIDVDQEIVIDASPADVFDFIAEPHNHVTFTPSLMGISDVEETDIGKRGAYTFKLVGATMEGEFEDVEFDRPAVRRYELSGDIEGQVSWTIDEVDAGSRVRYRSSLSFPGPALLESVTSPVLTRFSQSEVSSALDNLQVLLEESEIPA